VGSAVIHDDLELYLTERLRDDLAARPEAYCGGFTVSNKWPDPIESRPDRLLVIRDDSGPSTSFITGDRSVGFTLLLPDEQDANAAARMVLALATQVPGIEPGNPVATVRSTNGPYAVTEQAPGFRRYLTVTYGVAGRAL
jgi:hypothetical protein